MMLISFTATTASLTTSVIARAVELGFAEPSRGQVERTRHQRDRLADVVDGRREELLAQALDAVGQGIEPDRRGPVERVVDHGLAGQDVRRRARPRPPRSARARSRGGAGGTR